MRDLNTCRLRYLWEVLVPIPQGRQGTTKFWGVKSYTWIFDCVGGHAPSPYIVPVSTTPQPKWLKQQILIISQFWRLGVQNLAGLRSPQGFRGKSVPCLFQLLVAPIPFGLWPRCSSLCPCPPIFFSPRLSLLLSYKRACEVAFSALDNYPG